MSEDRELGEKLRKAYPADTSEPIPEEMREIIERAKEKEHREETETQKHSSSTLRGSAHMFLVVNFLTELA